MLLYPKSYDNLFNIFTLLIILCNLSLLHFVVFVNNAKQYFFVFTHISHTSNKRDDFFVQNLLIFLLKTVKIDTNLTKLILQGGFI